MSDLVARSIAGKIRLVGDAVFLAQHNDIRPCKCCALTCAAEVTIQVSYCGYTAELQVPIPGSASLSVDLDGNGPGESYIVIEGVISCSPCGWLLVINVCGYCEDPYGFASDGFSALIPFANSEETPGNGYCPEGGEVTLICFSEQFNIPCVTDTTATIA